MFLNHIQQDKSGLWIIRPKGDTTGYIVKHYEMPITITATGGSPDIPVYPSPRPIVNKCDTLSPIVFTDEKVLDCDLTKYTLNCWFDDITISANFAMNFSKLTWCCEPTFSWSTQSVAITFEYKDHLGQSMGITSNVAGGGLSGVGTPRVTAQLYNFTIQGDLPGPKYLGAIIPKARWYNGGGTFTFSGKMIFQFIQQT